MLLVGAATQDMSWQSGRLPDAPNTCAQSGMPSCGTAPCSSGGKVGGDVKGLLLRMHLLAVSQWPLRMAILSQGGQPGALLPPVLGEGWVERCSLTEGPVISHLRGAPPPHEPGRNYPTVGQQLLGFGWVIMHSGRSKRGKDWTPLQWGTYGDFYLGGFVLLASLCQFIKALRQDFWEEIAQVNIVPCFDSL